MQSTVILTISQKNVLLSQFVIFAIVRLDSGLLGLELEIKASKLSKQINPILLSISGFLNYLI